MPRKVCYSEEHRLRWKWNKASRARSASGGTCDRNFPEAGRKVRGWLEVISIATPSCFWPRWLSTLDDSANRRTYDSGVRLRCFGAMEFYARFTLGLNTSEIRINTTYNTRPLFLEINSKRKEYMLTFFSILNNCKYDLSSSIISDYFLAAKSEVKIYRLRINLPTKLCTSNFFKCNIIMLFFKRTSDDILSTKI